MEIVRLDHICFVLESKSLTLKYYYPGSFSFLTLIVQAGEVKQKKIKNWPIKTFDNAVI